MIKSSANQQALLTALLDNTAFIEKAHLRLYAGGEFFLMHLALQQAAHYAGYYY